MRAEVAIGSVFFASFLVMAAAQSWRDEEALPASADDPRAIPLDGPSSEGSPLADSGSKEPAALAPPPVASPPNPVPSDPPAVSLPGVRVRFFDWDDDRDDEDDDRDDRRKRGHGHERYSDDGPFD